MEEKNVQKYGIIQNPMSKIKNNVSGSIVGASIGFGVAYLFKASTLIKTLATIAGMISGAYILSNIKSAVKKETINEI